MKINGNAIRPGMIIEHNQHLWRAVKTQATQPGKGDAYNQVEMRNLRDNSKLNERFRAAQDVDNAFIGLRGGLCEDVIPGIASFFCARPVVPRALFRRHCLELSESDEWRSAEPRERSLAVSKELRKISKETEESQMLRREKEREREREKARLREAPLDALLGPITRRTCSGGEETNGGVQEQPPYRRPRKRK